MARNLLDVNKYIWIYKTNGVLYTDLKAEVLDQKSGVTIYYTDRNVIDIWRFDRDKWSEETARLYAYGTIISQNDYVKNLEAVQEYDEGYMFTKSERELIHNGLVKYNTSTPKLNTMDEYKNSKSIKDKMKLLANSSNKDMEKFINESLAKRIDVVKSDKLNSKPDFKIFANIEWKKTIGADGTDEARLTTTFTSNKADLVGDIVSRDALIKGVKALEGKVIPIRFEHGNEDFGVWDKFIVVEDGDVIYGKAEGLLDLNLSRSKDLWREITEYDKKFASSYGAYFTKMHGDTTENGQSITVVDEIDFVEISLTTRPANPDTVVESINKGIRNYFKNIQMEDIQNTITVVDKTTQEPTTETTTEVVAEVTSTETSTQEDVKPIDESATTEVEATSDVAVAEEVGIETKSNDEIDTQVEQTAWEVIKGMNDTIVELNAKIGAIYDLLTASKSVVTEETPEEISTKAEIDSLKNELKTIKANTPVRKSTVAMRTELIEDNTQESKTQELDELEQMKKNYPNVYATLVAKQNKF